MRCRQQWDWGSFNRQGYSPVINKPALSIGRLYHAAQAEWSLHPTLDPAEICKTLALQEIEAVQKAYLERIGAPMSAVEMDPLYDGIGMVISMVDNYRKRWGSPLPDGFKMVSPEQTCVVPIPGTRHVAANPLLSSGYSECTAPGHSMTSKCDGQHYLAGTLDGLIQSADGRLYVLERKTYGQRPKIEVLNMQDQFLAYLWVLRELKIGDVGGLAYDGAWKRKEPPRGNELEDLFIRVLLHRNRNELDRFTAQLTAIANDMADNPPLYINRRWDGCWDCEFVDPCIAQERGEDYQFLLETKYIKRDVAEDSTRELKDVA
jgi:hypothetical protein